MNPLSFLWWRLGKKGSKPAAVIPQKPDTTSSGSLLPHPVTQILNHKRAGIVSVPARLDMENRSVGVQLNIRQKQIVCHGS